MANVTATTADLFIDEYWSPELNRAIESVSYGLFKSEVYPGYDFWPIVKALMERDRK